MSKNFNTFAFIAAKDLIFDGELNLVIKNLY